MSPADVDALIGRIGAYLRDHHYALQSAYPWRPTPSSEIDVAADLVVPFYGCGVRWSV